MLIKGLTKKDEEEEEGSRNTNINNIKIRRS